jgi:hypothetical protein
MSKEKTNENIFGAAKRFSDAFFDGLKNNATDKMMKKAKEAGLPKDAIQAMDNIRREREILNKALRKYSK